MWSERHKHSRPVHSRHVCSRAFGVRCVAMCGYVGTVVRVRVAARVRYIRVMQYQILY